MSPAADVLGPMLQNLGLRAMEREYAACIINAENENWGYRRLLQRLLARFARPVIPRCERFYAPLVDIEASGVRKTTSERQCDRQADVT